jgi:hypothetical protein
LNRVQSLLYGRTIEATEMVSDPLFVIGHWRTGTTMVHELLSLDPQFAAPTTFQCFLPRCFLVSEYWLTKLTARLLPEKRPMDNMTMGWTVPQEDEFAILSMGLPTPYRRMAFPNHTPRHLDYLNMNGIPRNERNRWKQGLYDFIKTLNYHYRKTIVLKSPPHTGRISTLLEIFPKAKFIHISRSPMDFVPSTMHMWASLDSANGFQLPNHRGLESYVFDSFDRLYRGYFRDQHLLTAGNSVSVRFDEVVAQPVESLRRIYKKLDLGDFQRVEPSIQEWQVANQSYRRNKHHLPIALREKIDQLCQAYMREFDYVQETAAA